MLALHPRERRVEKRKWFEKKRKRKKRKRKKRC